MPATEVRFADLGLDGTKEYVVYEFWTDHMLGVRNETFRIPALTAMGLASYAIRERTGRPQLVSTSRHLTQGAVEVEAMQWQAETLSGLSRLVADDRYTLVLHVPQEYRVESATFDGEPAAVEVYRQTVRVSTLPAQTRSSSWELVFGRST